MWIIKKCNKSDVYNEKKWGFPLPTYFWFLVSQSATCSLYRAVPALTSVFRFRVLSLFPLSQRITETHKIVQPPPPCFKYSSIPLLFLFLKLFRREDSPVALGSLIHGFIVLMKKSGGGMLDVFKHPVFWQSRSSSLVFRIYLSLFIADFELFADIFIPVFSSLFPKQCQWLLAGCELLWSEAEIKV